MLDLTIYAVPIVCGFYGLPMLITILVSI
ncbi:uncharacterized protein METZ01_LOCUS118019 [marine metagenome]|uniref:Uncharacterized protein n=1 Tax=marine metagenome TaxID=408172 RepID=A0A381XK76_9ZZZZ